MIHEGTVEITHKATNMFNDQQPQKVDMDDLFKTPLFFAARRHLYNGPGTAEGLCGSHYVPISENAPAEK